MKNKNITTLVLEGCDGAGKTSLATKLREGFDFRYMIQHRGELSAYVYAKKYGRTFTCTERHIPILYIFLKCSKEKLIERIKQRGNDLQDIQKVDDEDLFEQAAKDFEKDYNIITVDTSNLTVEETYNEIVRQINLYLQNIEEDKEVSEWNKMYEKGCQKCGLTLKVIDNQLYFNDRMVMSESTLQNGVYETFKDKTFPDNFIYSLAYDNFTLQEKTVDFSYIINSKSKRRLEIFDYYDKMKEHNKSCLISSSIEIEGDNFIRCGRTFGNDFISLISQAKATIYVARDLEYLKLQTARLYEAILAKQIVFVDKKSDKDCDILRSIHKNNEKLISLLYVDENDFIDNYNNIIKDKDLLQVILDNQDAFYDTLKSNCKWGQKYVL